MSKEYNIINATASAFKRCCAKSFKNGRAGRAEFWWFILGQYAVMVVLSGFIEIMRILLDFMLIMEVLVWYGDGYSQYSYCYWLLRLC